MASMDENREVRLWDALVGNCLQVFQCEQDRLRAYWFEENHINFSPDGQLLACRGAEVKVFRVATGKLASVCEVQAEKVCWNNSGNGLAIVTNNLHERDQGHQVLVFDTFQVREAIL